MMRNRGGEHEQPRVIAPSGEAAATTARSRVGRMRYGMAVVQPCVTCPLRPGAAAHGI